MFNEAGTAALTKVVVAAGGGILGALVMAAVDPPKTRMQMFLQASCAGIGSMVFGGVAIQFVNAYVVTSMNIMALPKYEFLEWAVPVYFLVGAMSWGIFGAIAKFRALLRDHAAGSIFKRFFP